jgi:hypothetical protein
MPERHCMQNDRQGEHAETEAGRNSMHGLLDRQAKPAGRLDK